MPPLTDPGVQYSRTELLQLTRGVFVAQRVDAGGGERSGRCGTNSGGRAQVAEVRSLLLYELETDRSALPPWAVGRFYPRSLK